MAYSKKTWKDRITEYPNRRELTYSDSSTELVTVARSEGTISQEGDAFSAQNMNDLEGRIDNEFSAVDQNLQEINDNLSGFKFYPTGTGIVGLISDDSAYTDEDGNYVVWGTATANQLVEDNPNTYKAVASEYDTRGRVGEDTAKMFGGGKKTMYKYQLSYNQASPTVALFDIENNIVAHYDGSANNIYNASNSYFTISNYHSVSGYGYQITITALKNLKIHYKDNVNKNGELSVNSMNEITLNVNDTLILSGYADVKMAYVLFKLVD